MAKWQQHDFNDADRDDASREGGASHDDIEALVRAAGNKAEAARLLGVPRSTLFSKLRKYGLD